MRILGVDPGTLRMGVGIVDAQEGKLDAVHYDVLTCSRRSLPSQRLYELYQGIVKTIETWSPDEVAIEEPFVARNVRSAMAVGQAQAVAMLAAAHFGLPVSTYSPPEIKKAVTDFGGSAKSQVQEMVRLLLGLPELPQPDDAADALAVAICHVNASRVQQLDMEE